MDELNVLILKNKIYQEIINIEKSPFQERLLFIQYITNLINFYEKASSSIFEEDIQHLRELVFINRVLPIFNYIKQLNNVDVLSHILSFFIGRTETKKYIYVS